MPDIAQQDIAYQPATKAYSFSSANPPTPNSGEKPKRKLNVFVLLILELLGLGILFVIFLLTLNYFKIISLSAISPIIKTFPKTPTTVQTIQPEPQNIPGTNQYEFEGTLEKYDQTTVGIKFKSRIIIIEYTLDSQFYYSKTIMNNDIATPAAETLVVIEFPSTILSKGNIGKKVFVRYTIEKNKSFLNEITLAK